MGVTDSTIPTRPGPVLLVTGMVTRIHKNARRRLFLREHRKAKKITAPYMAGRMGMERESLLRLEREWWRVGAAQQAEYAEALGIEPEALWRLPEALLGEPTPEDIAFATAVLNRLASNRR
jgi:transcriptional regulator with XRE-family HTH domain